MGGLYDEIRLAIHAVWTRRWVALGVAWGVCLLGWLVVSQIPNSYESRARVFVQMRSVLPSHTLQSQADQARELDSVRQTLTSAVNLEKVVRGTDLANTVATDKDVAERAAGLQAAITLTAQQDNLFELRAKAASPKLSRDIVQKLIDIFVDENLAGNRDDSDTALRFLDAQIEARQKQLQGAEAKRAEFQANFMGSLPGTGSLDDRMGLARSQLAQVESDLAAAQSGLAAVNGQMAGTQASLPGAAGTASLGPARARVATIQGQIAEARGRGWTDQHPDMVALRSQLAQAQSAARGEPTYGGLSSGGSPNPLYLSLKSMQADKAAQVAALSMRKAQLQSDLGRLQESLADGSGAAAEQAEIDRDYQVLKDQYEQLLADRETARLRSQVQAQTGAVKFQVIDPPMVPRLPSAPNRPLLLFGVLIVGVGAGIGVAFALGQLRSTFATAGRLEKATGLPVIGAVSEVVTAAERMLRRKRLVMLAGGTGALAAACLLLVAVEMIQRSTAA